MALQEGLRNALDSVYQEWYTGINKSKEAERWGELCGGITILENLLGDYTLSLAHHQTAGGTQLKHAGRALGRKVLSRFGVALKVRLGEFGRTSRGGPPAAERLMRLLEPLQLEGLPQGERNDALLFLQERMAHELEKFSERVIQVIETQPGDTFEKLIGRIIAAPSHYSGAVAQHLVGAKLTMRFQGLSITVDVAAAADAPTNRPGDFLINDTAFHITLSPQPALFEKCVENLRQGYNVYLLVPEDEVAKAKKRAAEYSIKDQITIKSIESFVAQNIDEIAIFSKVESVKQRAELLRIYNERVDRANERYAPHLSLSEGEVKVEGIVDEGAAEMSGPLEEQNGSVTKDLFGLLEDN